MNKTTLVMLALCAGLPMMAQVPSLTVTSASGDSNIQMYGIFDLGIGTVAHGYSFDDTYANSTDPRPIKVATHPVTGMLNGGLSGDRLGFRGSASIAGDWKAIFNLEAGINLNSGYLSNGNQGIAQNVVGTAALPAGQYSADSSLSGQLFGRAANFGAASGTCGTLTLGRNTGFMTDIIPGYDPLNGAQMFTPIGYSGTYGGGGETDNSRVDDSIKYRLKIAGVNLGLMHKFGGVAGSGASRSADQFNAGFEQGPFGIQFAYEKFKDATSVANYETYSQAAGVNTYTNPNMVKVTFYDTEAYMLAVRYQLGDLALRGGYQKQNFTNPSNPGLDSQITSIFGQVVGAVSTAPMTVGGAGQTKTLNVFWIGANYNVTDKFNVGVGYYDVQQNNFENGTNTPADGSGRQDFGSLLLDYHFSKTFDVYAGYMGTQYKAGMAVGYALASNHITGLGARFMF